MQRFFNVIPCEAIKYLRNLVRTFEVGIKKFPSSLIDCHLRLENTIWLWVPMAIDISGNIAAAVIGVCWLTITTVNGRSTVAPFKTWIFHFIQRILSCYPSMTIMIIIMNRRASDAIKTICSMLSIRKLFKWLVQATWNEASRCKTPLSFLTPSSLVTSSMIRSPSISPCPL